MRQARVPAFLAAIAAFAALVAFAAAQESPATEPATPGGAAVAPERPMADLPATAAEPGRPSPDKETVKRLTSLFALTLSLFLLMVVAMVAVGVLARRRAAAATKELERKSGELEDLWWKMEGPGAKVFDKPKEPPSRN